MENINFDLLKKRLQTIVGTSKYEETTVVDDLLNEATKEVEPQDVALHLC